MRALLAAALLVSALPAAAEEEIGVGRPAPAFSLRAMNPEVAGTGWIALERFVGAEPEDPDAKAVLLTFFASWCEPCRREMPFLAQLDRTYRDRGLRVLAVDIDREEAGMEAATKLAAAAKVGYPVLSDRFNLLARRYLGEQAPLPSVFLIRRDGTIARIERGYAEDASAFLLAEVQAVLGLERGPPRQAVAKKAAAPAPPDRPATPAALSR